VDDGRHGCQKGRNRGHFPLDFRNILLSSWFLTINGYETIKVTLENLKILQYYNFYQFHFFIFSALSLAPCHESQVLAPLNIFLFPEKFLWTPMMVDEQFYNYDCLGKQVSVTMKTNAQIVFMTVTFN